MRKTDSMIIVSTILIQVLFIAIINIQISIMSDFKNLREFLPLANLSILLLSGLAIVSIKRIEQQAIIQAETKLLKEHLWQVEELMSSLKTQTHEHIRHIQTIQSMLYLNEVDEAKKYLEGIAESNWPEHELVLTPSPALTALLNSRSKVAETKKIDFQFAVKCAIEEIALPSWDFSSILGNLLDNALEAVIRQESHRRVALEIKDENNQIVIYVSNTGAKLSENEQARLFEPGFSTKGSEARGFGLYIVKKLVESYAGNITVITEPKTTFIVSLPKKGGIEDDKRAV